MIVMDYKPLSKVWNPWTYIKSMKWTNAQEMQGSSLK